MRAWKKVLLTLLILAMAGGGGYYLYMNRQQAEQASQQQALAQYASIPVSLGSLSRQVVSTGTLSMADSQDVLASLNIKVADILTQVGDQVAQGDKLLHLDEEALDQLVSTLRDELASQDSSLASLANQYKSTLNLRSPVAGRVKEIYVAAGDFLQQGMQGKPGAMLLSLDGLMKAEFEGLTEQVGANSKLSISTSSGNYPAEVVKAGEGGLTVTFSDAKVAKGEEVQLLQAGSVIGRAQAQINMPYLYNPGEDGQISSLTARVNGLVARNGNLMNLSKVAQSAAYTDAYRQRGEIADQLDQARALLKDPYIYAPADGIISELALIAGEEKLADDKLLSLYVGRQMEMAISVDELDITHLKVGQQASLSMDALPEGSYQAQVSHISQIGQSSGGITNYTVTLSLSADDQLKIAMNGTATIKVAEEHQALLLPLAALQSDRQGSYVWLYQEGHEQTPAAPGIKTYVTTGLSDASFAAVTSGLSAGDRVLITRGNAGDMGGGMRVEGFGNMGMPRDGTRFNPGGGQRPGGN